MYIYIYIYIHISIYTCINGSGNTCYVQHTNIASVADRNCGKQHPTPHPSPTPHTPIPTITCIYIYIYSHMSTNTLFMNILQKQMLRQLYMDYANEQMYVKHIFNNSYT